MSMVFSFILLGLCYGYFIQATVRNAVSLDQTEAKVSAMNSTLGELESKYLSLSGRITPELAHKMGFKETEVSKFITRPTVGSTLSINNEI
jgi:hypothetical protein